MIHRTFGRTGIQVSAVGLGTWAMGGDEWGPSDDQESVRVIRRAVELGVSLIDTADVYGAGHSETLVGEAVPPTADVVVVTKVGWDIYSSDTAGGSGTRYDDDYILHAFAQSSARLQRTTIDVYLLHDPSMAVLRDGAAIEVLRHLKRAGQVRWIGVSIGTEGEALEALRHQIDVIELPFNVVRTWAKPLVLDTARGAGVAVIAREPLERGLLSGRYGPGHRFTDGDHRAGKGDAWITRAGSAIRVVGDVARRHDATSAQAALAYVLGHQQVSCVIAGARSLQQLDDNVAAAAIEVHPDEVEAALDA